MAIEVQVAAIYSVVRGHLDQLDPAKITAFEKEFRKHIRSSHKDLLSAIAKEGDDVDSKLKNVVSSFPSLFTS